jgi:hypothetical protein
VFITIFAAKGFQNSEEAWLGQRQFTYFALDALGMHPLALDVSREFLELQAKKIDLQGKYR